MKRSVVLLVALACFAISANAVFACQCDEYGTPVCARYWRADAVFVGQVREITPPDKAQQGLPTATLHFIVEQPFRGITTATVDVQTLSGTSCDMPLKRENGIWFMQSVILKLSLLDHAWAQPR